MDVLERLKQLDELQKLEDLEKKKRDEELRRKEHEVANMTCKQLSKEEKLFNMLRGGTDAEKRHSASILWKKVKKGLVLACEQMELLRFYSDAAGEQKAVGAVGAEDVGGERKVVSEEKAVGAGDAGGERKVVSDEKAVGAEDAGGERKVVDEEKAVGERKAVGADEADEAREAVGEQKEAEDAVRKVRLSVTLRSRKAAPIKSEQVRNVRQMRMRDNKKEKKEKKKEKKEKKAIEPAVVSKVSFTIRKSARTTTRFNYKTMTRLD